MNMLQRLRYTMPGSAAALAAALFLLSGCGASPAPSADNTIPEPPPPAAGTAIDPPLQIADFSMPSSTGAELGLADLQGKPTLLFFGYTFCPDICPLTLAEFRKVREDLGERGDEVNFVFISVDGERDTPERLAQYIEGFNPQFIGLQGTEQALRQIGPDFGLYYEKQVVEGTSASYLVDHSSASYLLDSEGRLVMVYSYGTPPEVISADLQTMLES